MSAVNAVDAVDSASDGAPLLDDLMPWAVRPLRLGRGWVMAPDAGTLKARWDALVRAGAGEPGAPGEGTGREALFGPTRARTLRTPVAQLPGQPVRAVRLEREDGPCPEPVRVLHGPHDRQWLIPDHRLIDAARPELWRVTDGRQIHLLDPGPAPGAPDVEPVFTELLPDGRGPEGRPWLVRPLYRRPGGREPNLAPGLLALLSDRLARPVAAEDVLAWTAAAARPSPAGLAVPLTADPSVWEAGTALGRRLLRTHTRGARCGDGTRPRLPGGRRPYVRAALPDRPGPGALEYDAQEESLFVGEGRIAPVAPCAWEFEVCGTRVLRAWLERRTAPAGPPGTLEAVVWQSWPQERTSELLELITTLTLLGGLREERREFFRRLAGQSGLGAAELRSAGVLPVPRGARRPASVLDHREEGPDGQLALL